jgi:NAD(P)-dependent dehydrogenase (short-subunit alcohol dehydrogenase family)
MAGLKGKTVLVTGAARRIGREIALEAARAGANVAITYLGSERDARRTLAEVGAAGAQGLSVRCDVREPKSVIAAVRAVVCEFRGIDVLVNNAAVYETARFEEITLQQWDNIFATNARGPFLVSRAALDTLRERRGRIVNLGSLGGLQPWATHAHYCASKAALIMLTQVMAKALAPEVAVNCVAPGMIDMDEGDKAFFRRLARKTPMRRSGEAREVAAAVMFFATAPRFITGQTLVVDGGLSLG